MTQKDKLYEVEKIIKHVFVDKQKLYEIKWKNYPHSENTFEPLEHLSNVKHMIRAYEKLHGQSVEKKKESVKNVPEKKTRQPFKNQIIDQKKSAKDHELIQEEKKKQQQIANAQNQKRQQRHQSRLKKQQAIKNTEVIKKKRGRPPFVSKQAKQAKQSKQPKQEIVKRHKKIFKPPVKIAKKKFIIKIPTKFQPGKVKQIIGKSQQHFKVRNTDKSRSLCLYNQIIEKEPLLLIQYYERLIFGRIL